jgi:hypothetical protein
MNALKTCLENKWTTIGGVVLAVLYFLAQVGTLPATGTEWMHFVVALALAVVGAVSKDALTGSKPGDKPALTVGGAATEMGDVVLPTSAATPEAQAESPITLEDPHAG